MFKFARDRIVLWPVTIKQPADGGAINEIEIRVKFKLLKRDLLDKMEKAFYAGEADQQDDLKILLDHVVGWDGIEDAETGEALPYSVENLQALLNESYIRTAIQTALVNCSLGAPAKN